MQERGQPITTTPLIYTVHVSALGKSRHQALQKILVERQPAHSRIKFQTISTSQLAVFRKSRKWNT